MKKIYLLSLLMVIVGISCEKETGNTKQELEEEGPTPEPTSPPETLEELSKFIGRTYDMYSNNVSRTIINERYGTYIKETITVIIYIGYTYIEIYETYDKLKTYKSRYWLTKGICPYQYHANFTKIAIEHYLNYPNCPDVTLLNTDKDIDCSLTWDKYPVFNLKISYETENGTKVLVVGNDLKLIYRYL